jgi:hypothetical protein
VPARTFGTISGRGKYRPIFRGESGVFWPSGGEVEAVMSKVSQEEVGGVERELRICSRARPPFL